MSEPKKTRLIEAVECGLSEDDRETLASILEQAQAQGFDEWLDLLDRLPRMVEDRDRELADAEYEVLCAKLEVDTIRQLLADVLARGQQPNYVSMPGLTYPKLPGAYEMRAPMPGEGDVICD